MKYRLGTVVVLLAALAITGCGGDKSEETATMEPEVLEVEVAGNFADAAIDPKSGSTLTGMAIFKQVENGIWMELTIENAPPGTHAAHIHEFGDCSAEDGTSAGGHWNPASHDHGKWGDDPFHLGDLGNIEVGENGMGVITMQTDLWSLGSGKDNDVVGKSIIVHAAADDFTTQPTGAAGGRIGCGLIEKK